MAKISAPPIPLKMYRRFAVATVLFTACIAMFADGENRGARATNLEVETSEAKEKKPSEPSLVRRAPRQQQRRSGYAEQGEVATNFGAPMIKPSGGGNSDRFHTGMQRSAIPGYSQDYLDSLSVEEYRRLLESLADQGMLDPHERQQNIRALEAASRRRSGNAGGND